MTVVGWSDEFDTAIRTQSGGKINKVQELIEFVTVEHGFGLSRFESFGYAVWW